MRRRRFPAKRPGARQLRWALGAAALLLGACGQPESFDGVWTVTSQARTFGTEYVFDATVTIVQARESFDARYDFHKPGGAVVLSYLFSGNAQHDTAQGKNGVTFSHAPVVAEVNGQRVFVADTSQCEGAASPCLTEDYGRFVPAACFCHDTVVGVLKQTGDTMTGTMLREAITLTRPKR